MGEFIDTTAHVLVIDDDAVMRELLSLLLSGEGETVLTAESGDAALELLATLAPGERPSVVLTDLNMPGLSQSDLAVRLRLACPPPALLVAMSGSEPSDGSAAAFDAFLLKPFTVEDLSAAIERARTKASPLRQDGGSDFGEAATALDPIIFAKLSSVMGAIQLPKLYTLFMDDAANRLVLMQTALSAGDSANFSRQAHAIKGGCGMLGATELHALAGRMEAGGLACSSLLSDFRAALERLRRILEEQLAGTIGERIEL